MKKTIFTLALLAGLSDAAQAQHSNVSLGLKAGGAYSSFVGAQSGNASGLLGFQVGAFANLGLSDMVALQPEVLYSQKGAKATSILGDYSTRLQYIDVPLAIHVNADGLFFEAGPQIGFLLAADNKYGAFSNDVKSTFDDIDFGYLAGLGYQRKTGPGIGLRYNGGFTNLPKAVTVGGTTFQSNIRNSVFQLYLTYSFGG